MSDGISIDQAARAIMGLTPNPRKFRGTDTVRLLWVHGSHATRPFAMIGACLEFEPLGDLRYRTNTAPVGLNKVTWQQEVALAQLRPFNGLIRRFDPNEKIPYPIDPKDKDPKRLINGKGHGWRSTTFEEVIEEVSEPLLNLSNPVVKYVNGTGYESHALYIFVQRNNEMQAMDGHAIGWVDRSPVWRNDRVSLGPYGPEVRFIKRCRHFFHLDLNQWFDPNWKPPKEELE